MCIRNLIDEVAKGANPSHVIATFVEGEEWKPGDPVPDGYMVVFGKLVKGDKDHKSEDRATRAHSFSTTAHTYDHALKTKHGEALGKLLSGEKIKYDPELHKDVQAARDAHRTASNSHDSAADKVSMIPGTWKRRDDLSPEEEKTVDSHRAANNSHENAVQHYAKLSDHLYKLHDEQKPKHKAEVEKVYWDPPDDRSMGSLSMKGNSNLGPFEANLIVNANADEEGNWEDPDHSSAGGGGLTLKFGGHTFREEEMDDYLPDIDYEELDQMEPKKQQKYLSKVMSKMLTDHGDKLLAKAKKKSK